MSLVARGESDDGAVLQPLRELADRMFSRAAGAPLIGGNQVRLLEDGRENYPAWLAAIRGSTDHVHFENYLWSGAQLFFPRAPEKDRHDREHRQHHCQSAARAASRHAAGRTDETAAAVAH